MQVGVLQWHVEVIVEEGLQLRLLGEERQDAHRHLGKLERSGHRVDSATQGAVEQRAFDRVECGNHGGVDQLVLCGFLAVARVLLERCACAVAPDVIVGTPA